MTPLHHQIHTWPSRHDLGKESGSHEPSPAHPSHCASKPVKMKCLHRKKASIQDGVEQFLHVQALCGDPKPISFRSSSLRPISVGRSYVSDFLYLYIVLYLIQISYICTDFLQSPSSYGDEVVRHYYYQCAAIHSATLRDGGLNSLLAKFHINFTSHVVSVPLPLHIPSTSILSILLQISFCHARI
jgi:hypothetical protein